MDVRELLEWHRVAVWEHLCVFACFHNRICSFSPCSTVLLEKLTGPQLVKKFPTLYGIRRFITASTTAQHLSLPWATWMQPCYLISLRLLIVSSSLLRLGLSNGIFRSGFPIKILYPSPFSPYMPHGPPVSSCLRHFLRSINHTYKQAGRHVKYEAVKYGIVFPSSSL
jgi:hypothetical protein